MIDTTKALVERLLMCVAAWRREGEQRHTDDRGVFHLTVGPNNYADPTLEDEVRALAADALGAGGSGNPVAWMLRNAGTGKIYWDAECCVFDDSASANDCAEDMNENIDDAEFEIFPLYASPPAPTTAAGVE